MIKLPYGISESRLRTQVQNEYANSLSMIQRKRMIFRQWDQLLNGVSNDSKIDLKGLWQVFETVVASAYRDKKTVVFKPNNFSESLRANYINKLTRQLWKEMNMPVVYLQMLIQKFEFGVGVRIRNDWAEEMNAPVWSTIDTRTWVPDTNGGLDWKSWRYEGFEMTDSWENINANKAFDNKAVQLLSKSGSQNSETNLTKTMARQAEGLNASTDSTDHNGLCDVYHHFTIIDGRKFYTVWWDDRKALLLCEEIKPVFDMEKKNPGLVRFPTVHNYYMTRALANNDPFGVSLIELMADKNKLQNVLINLAAYKEKNFALGDDFFYDQRLGIDRGALTTPSMGQRHIPVDGSRIAGGNLNNGIVAMPKNPAGQSSYNLLEYLEQSVASATAIDKRQMGLAGSRAVTLGEAQQLQANNNIKSLFREDVNTIGEVEFWRETLRSFKENFKASDKKILRLSDGMADQLIELKKSDIVVDIMPDIDVISEIESKQNSDTDKANLSAIYWQMLQDPSVSNGVKNIMKREWLKLNGKNEDEVRTIVPPSPEELNAEALARLLNNDDIAGAKITDLDEDHYVYLTVFQRCMETPAKQAAILARKQAIILAGKKQKEEAAQQAQAQQGQPGNQMANSQNAALIAQASRASAEEASKPTTRLGGNA